MGAGSSASPKSETRAAQDRGREAPPQAALAAAAARGDVVTFDVPAGRVALCLCKPRRLELMRGGVWTGFVSSMMLSVERGDGLVDLSTRQGDQIAQLAREPTLLATVESLSRLATRASVPHDLWGDIRTAGIEIAQVGAETCYYCNRHLATAPAFCHVTNRLHPIPTLTCTDEAPPAEALAAAEGRGDAVCFATETGSQQKFVFVKPGRLEKIVDGVWRRPVTGLEVPHVGARTLRDFHAVLPAGCMLRAEGIPRLLCQVAVLADRAGVGHNLWEHSDPAPACPRCQQPLHKYPVCPVTGRRHEPIDEDVFRTPPSAAPLGPVAPPQAATLTGGGGRGEEEVSMPAATTEAAAEGGGGEGEGADDATLRVRRHLSGPSVDPLTPQVMPLSPDVAEPSPSSTTVVSSALGPLEGDAARGTQTNTPLNNVLGTISDECCVCLEEQKSTVLMPCRHLCVCAGCAQILTQCPLCRFAVVHRFEVY